MLQWIRNKLHGVLISLIAGAISLVFILGAGSYYLFNRNFTSKAIATVNGESISSDIVNNIYNDLVKRYYSKHKANDFNLDPQKIKQQILTDVVNRKATIHGLQRSGFVITDDQLVSFVKNDPNFQHDGKFSPEKYINLLQQMSLTEQQYQQSLREHLLIEQLRNNILLASFVSDSEVENFIFKWHQVRNFGYAVVPINKFATVEIQEQDIEDYYAKNKQKLLIPETVSIAYLDITNDKLINKVIVNRDILYKYYQEHLEYYTLPELVNVRHILISNNKDQGHSQSVSKAQELLDKLRLGESFDKLAKEYSEDRSSAKKGGDLGWIGKGEIDVDFEHAAFNLKKAGDVSDIVQSKFGYHLIQLIAKRESKVNNFEKIIDQVTKHYQEEQVQTKLQELSDQLAIATMANEDLTNIANAFNIPIQLAGPFSSSGTADGIASYREVIEAAFNIKNTNSNSDLIKLSEERFVVLRVTDKQPGRQKTLAESRDEIKSILQNIAAKEKAHSYSLSLAKQLLNSKSPHKLAKSENINWNVVKASRNDSSLDAEILRAAFSLNNSNIQKIVNLSNGDFIIIQLISIQEADLQKIFSNQPHIREQTKEQLMYLQAYLEQKLYEQELSSKAKIKFIANLDQL